MAITTQIKRLHILPVYHIRWHPTTRKWANFFFYPFNCANISLHYIDISLISSQQTADDDKTDGFGSSCVIARTGNSESRERMRGRKGRSSSTSFSIYQCFFTFKWPIGVSMSVTTGSTCHNSSPNTHKFMGPLKGFLLFLFF